MSLRWGIGQRKDRRLPYKIAAGQTCTYCTDYIFNQELYDQLSANANSSTAAIAYARTSRDLYTSAQRDCPWCSAIASGIRHVADFLVFENSEEVADPKCCRFPIANLQCDAEVSLIVRFRKHRGMATFDEVEIQIEVTGTQSEDCRLPEIGGPDTIFLTLQVSSTDSQSQVFQRNWGRISADSDDWQILALDWLESCSSHRQCRPAGGFHPSRLIDVTNRHSPRLINRDEIAAPDEVYVVLSYVWGPAQTYTLRTSSHEQLRRGLDPARLPKTLRDAMEVTARLGFRYIWIDALCIIQDSPDDLAAELPQMASIYQQGALTIIVASATSADKGFLLPPQGLHDRFTPVQIGPSDADEKRGVSFFVGDTSMQAQSFQKEPILLRAWTLQESTMSPRRLFFASDGVSWECTECVITYLGASPIFDTDFLSLCKRASRYKGGHSELYSRWLNLREEYCARALTFSSDKLNAFSAVASEIARTTGWTYLGGLWKEYLVDDLLWRCNPPKPSVAPSWSWASVAEGWIYSIYEPHARSPFPGFEVLDCKIEAGKAGPFGSVDSGVLDLKGILVDLGFRRVFRPDRVDDADLALLQGNVDTSRMADDRDVVAYGVTDPLDAPLLSDVRIQCLAVAQVLHQENVEGLMLLPLEGNGGFRRVGYFCAHRPSIFQGISPQVVRII
ncbi:HET-domain-containing protein [Aspergillus taichungensis]|uniref:HET-domain-containing protein n=1 Tax=Aspergillus taichungensis TaxID=482145 RepID=A0A2J5HN28_9EURO|nr:HET-domain-containing protein [Aspergillus taichungensis]